MLKRVVMIAVVFALSGAVLHAEGEEVKPASPPPLPCIMVEGTGGIFITPTAYLVNPSQGDEWLGLPSVAFSYASIGDKDFTSVGATMTFFKRIEVGVAHERFGLGSWPRDVLNATGLNVRDQTVRMNTVNLRALVLEEKDWLPAVTAGVHYKHNEDIWCVDLDLLGGCSALGVKDNDGWEFTLTASKTFVGILPRPFILTAGLRNTDAAQTGLLGFTGHRDTVFEGNAIFFITDQLLLAGEYRQKPDRLKRLPGLLGKEDDWWTLCAGYVVNDRVTLAAGYGNFGNVLNNREDRVWAVHVKFEF
ncbi:MAG TPA: DUF3034 family protein [Planctomycetota bacterium]|nr:DUF3034 family protein [Planctomycetota bacterium]